MNLVITVLLLLIITMSNGIALQLPKLESDETKESVDAWLIKTKSFLRAVPEYKPYVDITWTAKKSCPKRGFTDGPAVGTPPTVPVADQAVTKSAVVDAMLDLIAAHCKELVVTTINRNATSINSIHQMARKHYGHERTAMQMIQKISILQRQDNEKFNCIYNRVIGFRDDNMLKAGDPIQITNGDDRRVTIDADEPESRYA